MTKYHIECSFIHFNTKEKLYQVKIIHANGGICYQVFNKEQLKLVQLGE